MGRLISLTPKEHAILEVLMLESPDLVTYTRLIDRVWGPGARVDTNLVTTFVSHLRRKIDYDGRSSLIASLRGRGYRLAAPGA